ncbi:DUF6445 family protein [Aestuariibacter sp. A3R04]|uniref:DUF6445 family protein n=1 Tax=Aestuariibacter sp. A3R04 TaxID=2841571 RepID=UPI001C0A0B1E|nr:DUF6445 family protein [Aestuariibacter sp. A3R04]MBU3020715.1 hypothetical protein [Aestuariibacter sp. A3R04]
MSVISSSPVTTRYPTGLNTEVLTKADVFVEPDEVIGWVRQYGQFRNDPSFYPGIRAPMPFDLLKPLVSVLLREIRNTYTIPRHLKPRVTGADFSLITTPPTKLDIMQQLPHYDSVYPHHYAVLCYLAKGNHGGTGFFSHKTSGIHQVFDHNEGTYLTTLENELSHHELPNGYPLAQSPLYTLIDATPFNFNTLLVYPGNLLHSALISTSTDIDTSLDTGRLTANVFIRFD